MIDFLEKLHLISLKRIIVYGVIIFALIVVFFEGVLAVINAIKNKK